MNQDNGRRGKAFTEVKHDAVFRFSFFRFPAFLTWFMNLSQVIEALLFSAQKPLTPREVVAALRGAGAEDELTPNEFAKTTQAEVAAALEQLKLGIRRAAARLSVVGKSGRLAAGERSCNLRAGCGSYFPPRNRPGSLLLRSKLWPLLPTANQSPGLMSKQCAESRSRASCKL